ncbi:MAG: HypC/HybG/HupF family hydrogenase formation chaperone [Candidatus Thermoplasmatota archaeon]|jgi:hydrogenase expression/formation protein HypC|nr:HypC/HybG/HupF family hydrogenase formation chaperone [Candidatus Thermoplasmatota archaeon]
MCLAIPGRVLSIDGDRKALVDFGGTRRLADITFVNAKVGDYVIVHAGFALQVLDEDAARETLDLWKEALEMTGMEDGSA